MGRRSKYSSTFKAQVALGGLRGEETIQSLAKRYELSPSKITEWMRELEENLEMMRIIDGHHIEHPTSGVVHMRDMLRLRGYSVNEKQVRRLMRKMDILEIYPQKSLSKGTVPSYVHPYLLRGLKVERPTKVSPSYCQPWSMA